MADFFFVKSLLTGQAMRLVGQADSYGSSSGEFVVCTQAEAEAAWASALEEAGKPPGPEGPVKLDVEDLTELEQVELARVHAINYPGEESGEEPGEEPYGAASVADSSFRGRSAPVRRPDLAGPTLEQEIGMVLLGSRGEVAQHEADLVAITTPAPKTGVESSAAERAKGIKARLKAERDARDKADMDAARREVDREAQEAADARAREQGQ